MFKIILSLFSLTLICISNANPIEFESNNKTDIYEEVMNAKNFTGKVVLVTGSSSGIGEQIAKLFSYMGAKVVITGMNETNVEHVAQEVRQLSPHGLDPLKVVADLTKSEELEGLMNKTIDTFGQLDVVVNNAGIFLEAPITDPDFMKGFDEFQAIDVRSALQLTRLAIPYLIKTKGCIINISSVLTRAPQKSMLAYEVAKQSLEMTTKVLANELGSLGVRVNSVSPGSINTKASDEKTVKRIVGHTPLGRVGETIDVAKGVLFLASSDAQFITGVNIAIDGGLVYNVGSDFMTSDH